MDLQARYATAEASPDMTLLVYHHVPSLTSFQAELHAQSLEAPTSRSAGIEYAACMISCGRGRQYPSYTLEAP